MANISSIKLPNNTSYDIKAKKIFYAECSTARNVAAKVVSCDGFVLEAGAVIVIRFTNTTTTNPASGNISLNINGTGAKNIVPKDNNSIYDYNSGGYFYNNQTLIFVYNGTYFVHLNRDVNTDTKVTVDSALSSTSTNPVQNKVVNSALAGKAASSHTHSDYALKSLYGNTTINVGRKSGTDVGDYSTAEGFNTISRGHSSHAEGNRAMAKGHYSHAEGLETQAIGGNSHAEGAQTQAIGDWSHAEGCVTTANGDCSSSHGYYTQALHDYEVSFGKHNVSNDDTLFSIGDGDDALRHNAFEITTTGGKLHDKNIATLNDIPTSLPANGGNADTVDGKHAGDFIYPRAHLSNVDLNTILYPCSALIYSDCTNKPPVNSWGTLLCYSGGTGSHVQLWVAAIDSSMFKRHYDGARWSDWKEISTTPIKSTGWITTPTNDNGEIYLPEGNSRNYLSFCSQGSLSFMFHSGSTYRVQIRDSNMAIVQSTPITYIAFYIK